ncbi:hemolysin-III related-domain-containing protein [Zopfochytrium polystomum]|nr:hemolysin-III related-domain-containing protein [Zopfochytrium polystomum]
MRPFQRNHGSRRTTAADGSCSPLPRRAAAAHGGGRSSFFRPFSSLIAAWRRPAPALLRGSALPAWYLPSPFIDTGYRPIVPSIKECVFSLRYLHNESGNFWTHAVGAVLFVALVVYMLGWFVYGDAFVRGGAGATWRDILALTVFHASAIICLTLSSTFHLLCCHSHEVSSLCLKADYLGIVILIVGSFVPSIYYAFYCDPLLQGVYIGMVSILGISTIAINASTRFLVPRYRPLRTSLFLMTGFSAIVPVVHASILYGFPFVRRAMGLVYVLIEGATFVLAVIFYLSHIPERWFPGTFDLIGHSHQIFHTLIVVASTFHFLSARDAFTFWHSQNPFCEMAVRDMAV